MFELFLGLFTCHKFGYKDIEYALPGHKFDPFSKETALPKLVCETRTRTVLVPPAGGVSLRRQVQWTHVLSVKAS